MIEFTVFGNSIAKARPRAFRMGNHIRHYTPDKTADWEGTIAGQAISHRPDQLIDGPIRLTVRFMMQRPKSKPKRITLPDCKPDLDNLCKAIKDALNGVIWTDDARIVELVASKIYGDPPRVEIRIEELEGVLL